MLYLAGCILITAYLTISFKLAGRWNVNAFQAIVFNYITCVITGSLFNARFPVSGATLHEPWFKWALLMGATFILLFNLVAFNSQRIGVATTAVAYKLSLVIPFVFSAVLYHEKLTLLRILGIATALVGVYLTIRPAAGKESPTGTTEPRPFNKWLLIWPVLLFLGSGLLDTMIKYVQQKYLNEGNGNDFLIMAFVSAAVLGAVLLLAAVLSGRQRINFRSILAGIAIGLPNYFSIWCMVEALKQYPGNSSAIIPIINMGIVLVSTVAAVLLFRERLSSFNWLGIILSLGAIALIAFG
jgi:drug/metabolite transporter (DMT)-like permease